MQWTELKAARGDTSSLARRLAIDKMATAIYPHWVLGEAGHEAEHAMSSRSKLTTTAQRRSGQTEQARGQLQQEHDAKAARLRSLKSSCSRQRKPRVAAPRAKPVNSSLLCRISRQLRGRAERNSSIRRCLLEIGRLDEQLNAVRGRAEATSGPVQNARRAEGRSAWLGSRV